jgi:hypothetical protein
VVRDASLIDVIAQRYRMIEGAGETTLILEAPQNRPPGGAYCMALYAGSTGPHQVDWYWQGQSASAIPRETKLLFDRVGLLRLETPLQLGFQPVPEQKPLERVVQAVNFCWAMLLISAKYVARSPDEDRMALLDYSWKAFTEACEFVGIDPGPDPQVEVNPQPRGAKLSVLRTMAARVEALMPILAARGGELPARIASQAARYLDLIARVVGVSADEMQDCRSQPLQNAGIATIL